jgi:predicted enzyme related to lactoylglutathione lyase
MEREINCLIDHFTQGRINRRQMVSSLLALAASAAGVRTAFAESSGSGNGNGKDAPPFHATMLDHIALRVTDVPRSRDFYRDLLGMAVTRESAGSCFLSFDRGFLALFRGDAPSMDHYCYAITDYDVREAEGKLRAAGLTPRVTGNRIYFPDPDGLVVQLAADRA